MVRILYLAFALSGGAGLIYEAVWGRYLALFLGHSAYAQVLVIATYLGGMAVGALAAGQASRRVRAPLLWYAGAEAGLALLGLLFHLQFQLLIGFAYDVLIPVLGSPGLIVAGKWTLALVMLLPQAILLGTTFPLISAGVLRGFPGTPGHTLSLLYFANSLGASLGVLVGGFALVAWVGLPGSLAGAALLNLVAALVAFRVHGAWVGEGGGKRAGEPEEAPRGEDGSEGEMERIPAQLAPTAGEGRLWRLLLGVSFLTAVASFAYEIGWIRMLSLVMGSATHSFEVMLSAFILGLALGALLIRRFADDGACALPRLGWIQWFMGLAALGTLPVYLSTFDFMGFLLDALPRTDGGYLLFSLARYGIAIAVMLPSTILAGMTLPLITATLLHGGHGERSIGWVYGVNTTGSVLGVAIAGLLALPALGLKGLIVAGATLDMGVGVALLYVAGRGGGRARRWHAAVAMAGVVVATLGVHLGVRFDRRLLTSGVFRYGQVSSESEEPVLFYQDGRTASVGVHLGSPNDLLVLSTNGKPDASVSLRWVRAQSEILPPLPLVFVDEATQNLLGLIPLAHVPRARSVAHIGHGSGMTGHLVLGSPYLERSVTIEIEPAMILGSQELYPANGRVFDDPRSEFAIDDAKSYFAGRRARFNLIISEPSNPWVSGTASLFTREFYQRVVAYLAPGGVFAQWMHLYEMNDALVSSVLAAIHELFPAYRIYLVGSADILVVASPDGDLAPPDWSVLAYPGVARTLAHVPPLTPRRMESLLLFDRRTLAPVLEAWSPVNSDFRPFLDLGAEKARFQGDAARGYVLFAEGRVLLDAFLQGARRGFPEGWEEPVLEMPTFQALSLSAWLRHARSVPEPNEESPSPRHARALESLRSYGLILDGEEPPTDWMGFMALAREVEGLLHGGTAGVADTLFYDALFRFLRTRDAPPEARAAADFLYGVAAWDHPRVTGATPVLLDAADEGREWLPPSLLLEGGILAHLARNDGEGARRVLERVGDPWGGGGVNVRLLLLRALAEEGRLPPGAGGVGGPLVMEAGSDPAG